jgi:hypothetical protein
MPITTKADAPLIRVVQQCEPNGDFGVEPQP